MQEEKEGSKYCALGNSRDYRSGLRLLSVHQYALASVLKEGGYPFVDLAIYTIVPQLAKDLVMWNLVEGLGKVQYCDIYLLPVVSQM